MAKPLKIKAIAYLRTSSAQNVGADKDSAYRQSGAINRFADANGFELVASYYDAAVSGADALEARAGFSGLLDHIRGNGVRHVIVEAGDRLARHLMVQETGLAMLTALGVTVMTSTGDCMTDNDDPTRVLFRQMLGSFAQFERATLVAKLKGARERKRIAHDLASDGRKNAKGKGKCGGRNRIAERNMAAVELAKALTSVRKGKPSLRTIADTLAAKGHVSVKGTPFSPSVIQSMLTAQIAAQA